MSVTQTFNPSAGGAPITVTPITYNAEHDTVTIGSSTFTRTALVELLHWLLIDDQDLHLHALTNSSR